MSQLKLNADGTVDVPLRDGSTLHLVEPSMEEVGQIHDFLTEAEAGLPPVPLFPTSEKLEADPEVFRRYTEEIKERERAIYGSAGGAFGEAFLRMCNLLSDGEVTKAQLPGWVMSPDAGRKLFAHVTDPLHGAVQE